MLRRLQQAVDVLHDRTRRSRPPCASSFARSRTFFGYRTFSTSSFIAAISPPAPSTSSALSRYSGRGIRFPPSILYTRSSPYPTPRRSRRPASPPPPAAASAAARPSRRPRRPTSSSGSTSQPGSSASVLELHRLAVHRHAHPSVVTAPYVARALPVRHRPTARTAPDKLRTVTVRTRSSPSRYAESATLSDVNQQTAETRRTPAVTAQLHRAAVSTPRGARLARLLAAEQLRRWGLPMEPAAHSRRRTGRQRRHPRPRTRPGLPAHALRRSATPSASRSPTRAVTPARVRTPVPARRVGPRPAPRGRARRPLGRHRGPLPAQDRLGRTAVSDHRNPNSARSGAARRLPEQTTGGKEPHQAPPSPARGRTVTRAGEHHRLGWIFEPRCLLTLSATRPKTQTCVGPRRDWQSRCEGLTTEEEELPDGYPEP